MITCIYDDIFKKKYIKCMKLYLIRDAMKFMDKVVEILEKVFLMISSMHQY